MRAFADMARKNPGNAGTRAGARTFGSWINELYMRARYGAQYPTSLTLASSVALRVRHLAGRLIDRGVAK